MKIGDRVKLIENPQGVLNVVRTWLRGKVGKIVEEGIYRDWTVEFTDISCADNQFDIDESDLEPAKSGG